MIDTLREYLEIMFFPYIEKKTLLRIVFIILLEPPLLSESLFKYFKPYMVFFNLMLKKTLIFLSDKYAIIIFVLIFLIYVYLTTPIIKSKWNVYIFTVSNNGVDERNVLYFLLFYNNGVVNERNLSWKKDIKKNAIF